MGGGSFKSSQDGFTSRKASGNKNTNHENEKNSALRWSLSPPGPCLKSRRKMGKGIIRREKKKRKEEKRSKRARERERERERERDETRG